MELNEQPQISSEKRKSSVTTPLPPDGVSVPWEEKQRLLREENQRRYLEYSKEKDEVMRSALPPRIVWFVEKFGVNRLTSFVCAKAADWCRIDLRLVKREGGELAIITKGGQIVGTASYFRATDLPADGAGGEEAEGAGEGDAGSGGELSV